MSLPHQEENTLKRSILVLKTYSTIILYNCLTFSKDRSSVKYTPACLQCRRRTERKGEQHSHASLPRPCPIMNLLTRTSEKLHLASFTISDLLSRLQNIDVEILPKCIYIFHIYSVSMSVIVYMRVVVVVIVVLYIYRVQLGCIGETSNFEAWGCEIRP